MGLISLPPELLLYIFSYLDLPDLAALSAAALLFRVLAADPLLHRTRLRVVAPSRVEHALFAANAFGVPLRPTVLELAQRGVFQALNLDRVVRLGLYLYSPVVRPCHCHSTTPNTDYLLGGEDIYQRRPSPAPACSRHPGLLPPRPPPRPRATTRPPSHRSRLGAPKPRPISTSHRTQPEMVITPRRTRTGHPRPHIRRAQER